MAQRSLSASLLLLLVLLAPVQQTQQMHDKNSGPSSSRQLTLFHWWNAYSETQPFGPHAAAARLPIHEGGFIDGRSGHQWIQSISSYLGWRGGLPWRPETHRFNEVRFHYVECIALVHGAYYHNVKWWAASAPHAGEIVALKRFLRSVARKQKARVAA